MEEVMRSTLTALLRSVVLMVMATPTIATPGSTATFQGLGYLPSRTTNSYASAVSADGKVVVGSSWSHTGSQPFRWTASEGMTMLGESGGWANAVSCDGSVIVGTTGSQVFRWTTSKGIAELGGLPGSFFSEAYGVSADGSIIVGYSESSERYEAFIWTADSGMSEFEELSEPIQQSRAYDVSLDGSTVVGWRSTDDGMRAFRWTASGGMTGLADGGEPMIEAYGTSADGSVVVGRSEGEAVRWTASDGTRPIQVYGSPFSISADGSVVVGEGLFSAGCYEAFVWTESLGARRLNDILASVMPDGWFLYRATDLAVNGDIVTVVGHGSNPSGKDEAWIATFPVPEPSSTLALALALFGLGNMPMVGRLRTIVAKTKSIG